MTLHQWLALEGALVVTGCCFIALAAILWIARQVYWWRRLSSACGSEASAQATVRMVEADRKLTMGRVG